MSDSSRAALTDAKTIVVKVGSSQLANLGGGVKINFLQTLVRQIAALYRQGRRVVLVSSGAVAAGCVRLQLSKRPTDLAELQAAAAIGQCELMHLYQREFANFDLSVGQILLTSDGLNMRRRYLYARNTLQTLLNFGAVPVVNENDSVAVGELKLKMGDNDALAVAAAQLVDAAAVVILTDVPGLYDRPPTEENARLIRRVEKLTREHFSGAAGAVSGVGSGGMASKLGAALGAAYGGRPLVVAAGEAKNVLLDIFAGAEVGTFFAPMLKKETSRRQWFAFGRPLNGTLTVDAGAARALTAGKKSLLPIGVKQVSGDFDEGDSVRVVTENGEEIARGISNYRRADAEKIIGRPSDELAAILGVHCAETLVHRDNLVVME
ncbi:glutamate 5-kinase [Planctomycetales bacterium]|nr:glutamate 5-kinase [Planctomycetales bacterium]